MRRPVKKRPPVSPDLVYQSVVVQKFINRVMERGKKNTARAIVYGALDKIKVSGLEPLETFETALRNVGPTVEVRSRRVGGANYQVPHEVRPERRLALSLRWLLEAAKSKTGRPMVDRLTDELLAAAKNEGEAIRKRENVHKMAEANRAFAHFAWSGRNTSKK
ncbi:MAG: 30S ribosomal protein S7 [Candidatus Vogelbacteria bacterium]|nr:30S ribosomal protein S7 [Candidatus Vogelbacteria bacterium]